ncbi:MAG: hypothetical protein HY275_03055 [Gemmatimonadetes bacterium]|nr:hypothetical protein [Gemmatimonadota bacterium]
MTSPHALSCSRFRADHRAWLDLELGQAAWLAMERHAVECAACGAHDTSIRRALLVARNVRDVHVSPAFAATLESRLRAERAARPRVAERHRAPTLRTLGALAASLLAMAWVAEHRPAAGERPREVATMALPPVIPAMRMPQPVVRSAPLRNGGGVRVVSVRAGNEPTWTPLPGGLHDAAAGASLVAVSYTPIATR